MPPERVRDELLLADHPDLRDARWLSVKVLVEKREVHGVMDALEKLGRSAILEMELRHTKL